MAEVAGAFFFGCAFFFGRVLLTVAAACLAWRLDVAAAVADVVAVETTAAPLPDEGDDPLEFAAAMITISAMKAKSPVSAL